ncbi:MAG: hypothetical protein LBS63_03990 [Prevotellaceae bacterium]|jgi:hypothetical protein|nr:hypothetical protein [Prevotellaceae bacterium]
MKKVLLTVLLGFSVGALQAQDEKVTLDISAPQQAVAGTTFTVTVSISKPEGLSTFARFHQDLGKGFEADTVEGEGPALSGAIFDFSDQRLRFIWARMPEASLIKLKYRIRITEPRLKGNLLLSGKFTCVVNQADSDNKVLTGEATASVAIQPAKNVEASQVISIGDEQSAAAAKPAVAASAAAAPATAKPVNTSGVYGVRQKPYMVDRDYYVNIMVNKAALSEMGKIEEVLSVPTATIEPVERKEALFSIDEGNKIKFVWITLPEAEQFVISYKIVAWKGTAAPAIKGVFTYDNAGVSESKNIVERDIDYSESVPVPPLSAATQPTEAARNAPAEKPAAAPQRGLVFKVQLLATKQPVGDIDEHFKDYNIGRPVLQEVFKSSSAYGYKYVIGPFRKYEQARLCRDQMWSKGIADAFVTCYYNGDRISIQEANMLSGEQ